MVWFGLGVVLASAVGVTAVQDGSCAGADANPLAEIAAVVEQAGDPDRNGRLEARTRQMLEDPTSGPCVGEKDRHRRYLEDRERQNLEEAVKKAVDDVCSKNVCASNLGYSLLSWNPWVPVFGGCSNWSLVACDAIGAPAYWDKRREQRCVMPGVCHFVVVLTNPNTFDEYVIDAWSYAGGWSKAGRSRGSLVTTWHRFKRRYPRDSHVDNEKLGRCTLFGR